MIWTWLALPGFIAFAVVMALAVVVFAVRPGDRLNVRLFLFLTVWAFMFVGLYGVRLLAEGEQTAHAASSTLFPAALLIPLATVYLLATLDTPLMRPFQHRTALGVVVALTLAAEAVWLMRPELFLAGVRPYPDRTGWTVDVGPLGLYVAGIGVVAASIGASIVSWSASRHATVTHVRRRAAAFATAFATFNVIFLAYAFLILVAPGPEWLADHRTGRITSVSLPALAQILLAVVLVFGVLRYQTVKAESRFRSALRSTVVIASVALIFGMLSEGLEGLVPGFVLSDFEAGLITAALISFLLKPIERLAGALADRLMPDSALRREAAAPGWTDADVQVYREALDEAWSDGDLSRRDRTFLHSLAEHLGLPDKERRRLDREARAQAKLR